jgi:hypothetical protein
MYLLHINGPALTFMSDKERERSFFWGFKAACVNIIVDGYLVTMLGIRGVIPPIIHKILLC